MRPYSFAAVLLIPAAALAQPAVPPHARPDSRPAPTPAPEGHGREVDLRPRFSAGRDTRYTLDIVSSNRLKSEANPEISGDQTLTQSIGLRLHTVEVGPEASTVEVVYERIKVSLETADMRAAFDSASPAKPAPSSTAPPAGNPRPGGRTPPAPKAPPAPGKAPSARPGSTAPGSSPPAGKPGATDPDMDDLLAQIVRPMVGTKLTLTIDKNGAIKSVSGGEALAGGGLDLSALDGLGGLGTPRTGAAAGGASGWTITGPQQRGLVRVGETWTNTDSLGGTPLGAFNMVTRHTCNSATSSEARLSFSGRADAKSLGESPGLPAGGGFQLKESVYSGTYLWDLARGELKELTSTLTTAIEQDKGVTRLNAETRTHLRRTE